MPTFSFNWSNGPLSDNGGVVTATIPLEGTAEGFGVVFGTLYAHGVGTPSGTFEFIGVSFPESGEQVIGRGTGEWAQVAPDRWTTSGPTVLSTGQTVKGEGVFSLTERTWSGTFE